MPPGYLGDADPASTPLPKKRRGAIALTSAGLLALCAGAQQVPFIMRGDYSRRTIYVVTSPDQRFRLEVSRQARFPAFDILDPDGTGYFILLNAETHETVASAEVPLREIFDLQRGRARWTAEEVEVSEFDESQPAAVVRLPIRPRRSVN